VAENLAIRENFPSPPTPFKSKRGDYFRGISGLLARGYVEGVDLLEKGLGCTLPE
jgi:hypothetical protein